MIETALSPAVYWWLFPVIGLAGGIICGMLGMGGGSVMVPALVLLAGYSQKSAQGTALAVIVPLAIVAAVRSKLNPDISMDGRVIGLLIATGVIGALIGSELASRIPGHILKRIFAVFLILVSIKMLFGSEGAARGDVTADRNIERSEDQRIR